MITFYHSSRVSILDAPPEDAEEFPPPSPLAQQHTDVKLAARVQTLANAGSIETVSYTHLTLPTILLV